ncbi:hypothetical protein ACFC06_13235 [Nocardia sp. NPDC056064]|uniref:hypothetical protein n=1 Tax=Nocardia sp. NPDC056064 TaxID=3345701 RepID=UPI0035DB2D80
MTTGGWFNHYDDPDEFWDDEPLEPIVSGRRTAPVAPPASPQPFAFRTTSDLERPPRLGSRFVSMELDRGLLPVRIKFGTGWSRYVAPNEVGDELMAGYRGAVVENRDRVRSTALSSGRLPTPQDISDTATPLHRTRLMILLETETWDQYCETSSSMIGGGRYDVHGRMIIGAQHPVSVTADRRYVCSIKVWHDWAARSHPDDIGDEILVCAERIRSLRPKFVVHRDYSRYSDADLEYHLNRHRERLLEERVA